MSAFQFGAQDIFLMPQQVDVKTKEQSLENLGKTSQQVECPICTEVNYCLPPLHFICLN